MTLHDNIDYITEVLLRKAVQFWAKRNPKTLDMRTDTFVNGKRYLIHIRRSDYKDFEPTGREGSNKG